MNLCGSKRTPRTYLQVADPDGADARSDQLADTAPDGFNHATYLAIPSFSNRDLEERRTRGVAQPLNSRRGRSSVAEFHAGSQLLQVLISEMGTSLHKIGFWYLALRTHHA